MIMELIAKLGFAKPNRGKVPDMIPAQITNAVERNARASEEARVLLGELLGVSDGMRGSAK